MSVPKESSTPREMIRALSDSFVQMERENWALRRLLQEMGLSNAKIQRKVAAYLKSEDYRQSAIQFVRELTEETIRRLPVFDAEELFAEMPIKGPHQ